MRIANLSKSVVNKNLKTNRIDLRLYVQHVCFPKAAKSISGNLLAKQNKAPEWRADSPLQAPLYLFPPVQGHCPHLSVFHHHALLIFCPLNPSPIHSTCCKTKKNKRIIKLVQLVLV